MEILNAVSFGTRNPHTPDQAPSRAPSRGQAERLQRGGTPQWDSNSGQRCNSCVVNHLALSLCVRYCRHPVLINPDKGRIFGP